MVDGSGGRTMEVRWRYDGGTMEGRRKAQARRTSGSWRVCRRRRRDSVGSVMDRGLDVFVGVNELEGCGEESVALWQCSLEISIE